MATKDTEKTNVIGLDQAKDRKSAEFDLVSSLLAAAEYKTADKNITEVEIKRAGEYLFSVNIHPISDKDNRFAKKKATIYMPNPNGKKYPPIEKDFDNSVYVSWIIYLATIEKDQQQIWNNPAIMQKYGLQLPVESVDVLLTVGEKRELFTQVAEISGLTDDDDEVLDTDEDDEEYAKN